MMRLNTNANKPHDVVVLQVAYLCT